MNKDQIISFINDLPIEQRIEIADQILQSLHQIDPEIEKAWAKEARRRLDEFEEGKVKTIPGEQFDKEVQELKTVFLNDLHFPSGSEKRINFSKPIHLL